MTRTQEEIDRQIKGLKMDQKHKPEIDLFGEPTHKIINLKIQMLRGEVYLNQISEEHFDEDEIETAIKNGENVQNWLNGRVNEDLFESII